MAKKIFVCIKQVPDTETRFKLSPGAPTEFDSSGIKWILNPYDEYAIEEALKLKAQFPELQTYVISLGPKQRVTESLRTALAMGIDEAIVIHSENSFLTHQEIAKALAQVIKMEGEFFVVLTGKLAIDDYAGLVPPMLAEILAVPHVTLAVEAQWSSSDVVILRELEGGVREKIKATLPAVISCNKGLNTPRYPSLPGIMKAKKKVIKEINASDLSLENQSYKLIEMTYPPERPQPKILSGTLDEQVVTLVKALKDEAKVL